MDEKLREAKNALDKIIAKGRVHLYKPIQLAEILHVSRNRLVKIDIETLETYRTLSRKWRDEVSLRLVGQRSTSSARYQDDLFNENAMPPRLLAVLDEENKRADGVIEAYIYYRLAERLQDITAAYAYLKQPATDSFSLQRFLDYFEYRPGLKRSVDKAYEIVVYALFSTLVEELNVTITLTLKEHDPELLEDFEKFAEYVLGINRNRITLEKPARIYRGGVANAADRGLDMWTNFGPVVQVKHLRLEAELADDIAEEVATDDVVIVCKTAEARLIQSLLNQIGMSIRGIITEADLLAWYDICLTKYQTRMGQKIIHYLQEEFLQEFPALGEILSFLEERNYTSDQLTGTWQL